MSEKDKNQERKASVQEKFMAMLEWQKNTIYNSSEEVDGKFVRKSTSADQDRNKQVTEEELNEFFSEIPQDKQAEINERIREILGSVNGDKATFEIFSEAKIIEYMMQEAEFVANVQGPDGKISKMNLTLTQMEESIQNNPNIAAEDAQKAEKMIAAVKARFDINSDEIVSRGEKAFLSDKKLQGAMKHLREFEEKDQPPKAAQDLPNQNQGKGEKQKEPTPAN